jgi:pyruvate formate lyase activating enzyme
VAQNAGSNAQDRWQRPLENGRLECTLCPRSCQLADDQRGFCFVRKRVGDRIVLTTYGMASGFCVDPIEKKPLSHFFPGTSVLSFGTAGCNLGCKFCQNWDISKAKDQSRSSVPGSPEDIAQTAAAWGCTSVAFTYNDPVIFAEYAIDTARACHEIGIRTVAVTAGYISAGAREDFFSVMDAVNIDLKAFTPGFYRKLCAADLAPVLDTIQYVRHQTQTWLELTTLLIPGENDSGEEVDSLIDWVFRELGPDVPLHFSAFHPDYRLLDTTGTPPETCRRAREQAMAKGLHYVYTGNISDTSGQTTYCPACKTAVILRDGYRLRGWRLSSARCEHCHGAIAGRFTDAGPSNFGSRRFAVQVPSAPAHR